MTGSRPRDITAIRWSIKWKLMAIMAILIVGLVALLSYNQISSQKKVLEDELDNRIALMRDNLMERGKSAIISLSQQVENDIASYNFSGIIQAIYDHAENNPEIKYAILLDSSGMVHVHTLKPDLMQTELRDERARIALSQDEPATLPYQEEDESVIEIVNPLQISTEPWGVLRLVYTLKPLELEIEESREQAEQQMRNMVYGSIVTSLVFLGVCLFVIFFVSTRISKPLVQLTESAKKLSKGDFSASTDVSIRSQDEVGVLAETFSQMSKDLEESYRKLEDYSKTLEEKVEERTRGMHEALRNTAEARDRIDGIVKSVADGLIVTDAYNRVILMNRAAEDLLGVRLSEVIDRPIEFAIEEQTLREKVKETLDKKSTGYFFDFNLPGDDPKHPRIMRARTSVIHDREGKQAGIVTIMHDVTHEREVDRMKTEFISTAAHELRTPLTSIQGFSEILMTRDDLGTEERNKFLSYINRQSVGLTNIINDLLDISRIESGRGFALNKVIYNTTGSIRNVIPYFQEQYKNHRFEIIPLDSPLELYADKEKMEQVFKNLFSNAVKYSPNGGIIRVREELAGGDYVAKIEDNGVGMTSEQLEKVFDKFYRVDASDTGIEGTGLGMTIVKHIVEAHGGQISLESELGKGTTVTFTVPVESRSKGREGGKLEDD
jgi:PAS domain S-box-containing protein